MSASIIKFPQRCRRRRWLEVVEVKHCTDPSTGRALYVFEVVAADGRRVGVGLRDDLAEALDDVAWFRRGGVPVVEIGSLTGGPT